MVIRNVAVVSLLALAVGCSSSKSAAPPATDGVERLPDLKPSDPSGQRIPSGDADLQGHRAGLEPRGLYVDRQGHGRRRRREVGPGLPDQDRAPRRPLLHDEGAAARHHPRLHGRRHDELPLRLGAGGEGQAQKNVLPGDLAVHVPKGAQIVVNHHYLNPGAATVEAQSAINVDFADASQKSTRSSAVAWLDTSIRLPSGKSSVDVTCVMKDDLALWYMIPHMHRWGQHIRVVHEPGGDAKANALFDLDWDPDFTFHPPEMKKDPAQAYAMKKGEKLTIHCDWANDTGHDLTVGLEMCVVFGQTVDTADLGNISCDKGEWGGF